MPLMVYYELEAILTTKTGIPKEAVDDVLEEVTRQLYLVFSGESDVYQTPEEVLEDFYIPSSYLWAFCLNFE